MQIEYAAALRDLIAGGAAYLVEAQEEAGSYAGAFWSELAYHIPHLDYHAGGSHHCRTPGSAGLALLKLADRFPELGLRERAERAYDWACTRQHEDGGLFEITNNEQPSQFHLDYERSSISLGMVAQGMYKGLGFGLPRKNEYVTFLRQAAAWQMTVEVAPGNFLHSEGYPVQYVILNSCAHAAETLLIGAELTQNPLLRQTWRDGASRAVDAILAGQRNSGMYPYRIPDADQHTVSYTATCAWVMQNLVDAGLLARERVEESMLEACSFLADSVDDFGRITWDGREVHGQKHHTWVYGMAARCLAWWRRPDWNDVVRRMVLFVRGELYDPGARLARLYDLPLGETRNICGQACTAALEYACAFNQADMLDCLVDVEKLTLGREGACMIHG